MSHDVKIMDGACSLQWKVFVEQVSF